MIWGIRSEQPSPSRFAWLEHLTMKISLRSVCIVWEYSGVQPGPALAIERLWLWRVGQISCCTTSQEARNVAAQIFKTSTLFFPFLPTSLCCGHKEWNFWESPPLSCTAAKRGWRGWLGHRSNRDKAPSFSELFWSDQVSSKGHRNQAQLCVYTSFESCVSPQSQDF